MNLNDLIFHVRADLASHGIVTNDVLIADGDIHRAHCVDDKPGTLNIFLQNTCR